MPKLLFLLLLAALAGPLAAQPVPRPRTTLKAAPDVPATLDVAGLHLVLDSDARRLVQQRADALCRHQPSFWAQVALADGAFPLIDKILQQEGVPLDFRYLALQESALRGDAQSIHGAVGYWQLKRDTATELGLLVNQRVDERRHLGRSTRAAARYLRRSNATLRNWLNTLLSYNTGLSGVRPYVLPTDPDAREMSITAQTAPYVLMFLAHKVAFEPACGLNPRPALRLHEFPAVPGQTLAQQAQTLSADPAALAEHNRWLLAPAVPADQAYTLIVPITDAAQQAGLLANQRNSADLLNRPSVNPTNAKEVRVNGLRALIALPNETKEDLARRGGVKLRHFLHVNELTAFDAVVAGRPYYLESKRDAAEVDYHVARPGETLADIAQQYGLRRRSLISLNRMRADRELRPGRVLWLRHTRPREVAVEYRTLAESRNREDAPAPAASLNVLSVNKLRDPAPAAPAPPEHDDLDQATEALNAAPRPAPLPPAAPAWPLPPPAPLPSTPLAEEPAAPPRPVPPAESAPAPTPAPTPVPGRVAAPAPAAAPVADLPKAAGPPLALPTPPASAALPVALPASGQHVVQPSESVYAVARRYGLRPADLLAWNELSPESGLRIGQVLRLRPADAPAVPAAAAVRHTVAAGETLYSIARRYNIAVADLQQRNHKADTNVRIGEVLEITAPE